MVCFLSLGFLYWVGYIGASYCFDKKYENMEAYLIKMKKQNYKQITDIWEIEHVDKNKQMQVTELVKNDLVSKSDDKFVERFN